MNRADIYKDIRDHWGEVPTFLQKLPDSILDLEWNLLKQSEMDGGGYLPPKYRELIGLAVSASHGWFYGTFWHTEAAKALGASDDEITDALYFGKMTAGWNTYVNGLGIPLDDFKSEVRRIHKFASARKPSGVSA